MKYYQLKTKFIVHKEGLELDPNLKTELENDISSTVYSYFNKEEVKALSFSYKRGSWEILLTILIAVATSYGDIQKNMDLMKKDIKTKLENILSALNKVEYGEAAIDEVAVG